MREVHPAWAHRLPADEARSIELARGVDAAHGWAHVLRRVLSLLMLLVLCAALLWLVGSPAAKTAEL